MGQRWKAFRRWAHRLDHSAEDWEPRGLELADEGVRSQVLAAAITERRWAPVVVQDEDFVARAVANGRFSRSAPDVKELASRGFLQYAIRASDGADGVTSESLEKELEWRRSAGPLKRFGRWLLSLVQFV